MNTDAVIHSEHYERIVMTAHLLAFLIGLSATHSLAGETLVLGVEDDAAPWSKKDGTGYANELVLALYQAAGVSVELKVLPYKRCKLLTVQGRLVGCFNMAKIESLYDTIAFPSTPLFLEEVGYFHNVDEPLPVETEQDIPRGTTVGVVLGYEYTDTYYELLENGTIEIEESRSETSNLKKLAEGRIDTAILVYNETKPAEAIIERAGATGEIGLSFKGKALELHIGFSKAHPRGAVALAKYEQGIERILADGTYDRITRKWAEKALE
ncbi:MAG: substrate-binding periplasmic protein [Gammaproteobacteria bacterium]